MYGSQVLAVQDNFIGCAPLKPPRRDGIQAGDGLTEQLASPATQHPTGYGELEDSNEDAVKHSDSLGNPLENSE